jgi:hypothetical protein
MHHLRRWTALLAAAGGLWGLGLACNGSDSPPSGHERQARSEVLRDLLASREKLPDPQELQAELVEHGHTIPVERVAAMHEGKRRKRAREA